ncbi:DNA polymerase III subunit delta' [Marinomonas agarivorans]|nr:DNA polymerase III subunit delta' [Marinomonas agarivorans]
MKQTLLAPWLHSAKANLVRQKCEESLPHALLILGRDGGGQHELAQLNVKDILCQNLSLDGACGHCHSCHLVEAGTHPDFHLLDGREETIKIDSVRNVLKKVANKPQIGSAKLVWIAQAASMNINSANSILKALEEPPSETFFLLTSDANAQILPTIRSRCVLISLPTPSHDEAIYWLEQQKELSDFADLFWISEEPFTLRQLIQTDKASIYTNLPSQLADYLEGHTSVNEILASFDVKNSHDFIKGLLRLMQQCICYSTGRDLPNIDTLHRVCNLLLERLGIHKIMDAFQRLQVLIANTMRTNLNMHTQIKAELVFLLK